MTRYNALAARFREIALLEDASNLLHWDATTQMPDASAHARGEQMATLSTLRHRLLCEPALAEWLDEAEASIQLLNDWQQANLREMRRIWLHATCLDAALVEELSRLTLESEHVWFEARAANDFARMRPLLERILTLTRESAVARGQALGCSAYEGLLDQYDPGLRCETIDRCFDALAARLPITIAKALETQNGQASCNLSAPLAQQEALSRRILEAMHFDFSAGRLDTSPHPFCGGAKGDIRITTRYNEADFTEGLFGVLHESGHALYERQLPADWRYQPVGDARGMSFHESQSLFVEMQLAQSKPFMAFLAPHLSKAFGHHFDSETLYRSVTRVERGLIRVTADEVTYPAHIILRYQLEKAMLSGDLQVGDLPHAWAEGMRTLLGIVPDTDKDGCLQDIHWPGGAFGYFPTYTLGALIAAQLMETVRGALPDLDAQIEQGEFAPLQAWLGTHIHAQGSRYGTEELLQRTTGKPLGIEAYSRYIERKYLEQH